MRSCLLTVVLVLGITSIGSAGPIAVDHYYTYHLEGVITATGFAFPPETGDPLAELIPVGSLFTIDVVVDTSAPGVLVSDRYRYPDAIVGLVFNLNGLVYTMTSPDTNPFGSGVTYSETSISSDLGSAMFSGPLIDGRTPGTEFLFGGDAITQTGSLFMIFLGETLPSHGTVSGRVTSVDVPEPATILLMSSGIAIGLGSRLKKRLAR